MIGRCTHFDRRHDGRHIAEPQRADTAAQPALFGTVAGTQISKTPRGTPAAQAQRKAASSAICGLAERDCLGNMRLLATGGVLGPFPRTGTADRRSAGWHDDWRSTTSPPPDNRPACRAAPDNRRRTSTEWVPCWLGKTCDPRDHPDLDWPVTLYRQHRRLAHLGQHPLVRPGCIGNEMQLASDVAPRP